MTRKPSLAAALAFAGLLAGCPNPASDVGDQDVAPDAPPAIAVTGIELDASSLSLATRDARRLVATVSPADAGDTAVIWTSDTPSVASVDAAGTVTAIAPGAATIVAASADGGHAAACSVTVRPRLYAAGGAMIDDTDSAVCWIDGRWSALPVPSGTTFSYAEAIAVADGRVFVGGIYRTENGYQPAYWVDGELVELERLWPGKGGAVFALAIHDGHVYAGGFAESSVGACIPGYWLDGGWNGLPSGQEPEKDSEVRAINVAGGKVYAAGVKDSIPGYWVDGTWVALEAVARGHAYSLAIDGGNVYVAGSSPASSKDTVPCYWKDGARIDLPLEAEWSGYAGSMAIEGGTPYMAGPYYTQADYAPGYWAGAERRRLEPAVPGKGAIAKLVAFSAGRAYLFGTADRGDGVWAPGYWLDGAWSLIATPEGYWEVSVEAIALE